jgi:DNA-directed RNA polymerase subunit RPC12/RpoP
MTDVEHADLRCESCGEVADHELRYAGRLLESTRCSNCGHHILLDQRSLVPAYVRDLEQRLVSKPGRMLRRAARDPLGYARQLPGRDPPQPAKFWREFRELLR